MKRVNLPEALDGRDLDPAVLAEDLRNLEVLNRLFGGRSVLRRRLAPLLRTLRGERLELLDVGSGAGDLCRVAVEECRRQRREVRLWALDAHPQVQEFARGRCAGHPEIRFLRGDARALPLRDGAVHLGLCTLALHHFTEKDAVLVLSEMRRVARAALLIDICRGPGALAAVWFITRFTGNPMTRLDGPRSVRRGFTAEELCELARQAGWDGAACSREAWFRIAMWRTGEAR